MNQAPDLEAAVRCHRSGDLQKAEDLYRKILARDPEHPDALHLAGMAAFQMGNSTLALERLRQAIARSPRNAFFRSNLAWIWIQLGSFDEAEAAARQGIEIDSNHPESNNNLGFALQAKGKAREAEPYYERAIRAKPDYVDALQNLGILRFEREDLEGAENLFAKAYRLQPANPRGNYLYGATLLQRGQGDLAIRCLVRAAEMLPRDPDVQAKLGAAYLRLQEPAKAIVHLEMALQLRPDHPQALYNLGAAYTRLRRRAEAKALLERAAVLEPDNPLPQNNLGILAADVGRVEEAMSFFEKALALSPKFPEARFNRACLFLLQGDFERGWQEYAWGRQCIETSASQLDSPLWDGSPLPNQKVVLQAEQGFGDTIQFLRYAEAIKERVGELLFECPKPLLALAKTVRGVDRVIVQGNSLPKDALKIPLMDLPRILKTRLDSIPADVPYLHAEGEPPPEVQNLLEHARGLKVGLVWRGKPTHPCDDLRSFPAEKFAALRGLEGIHFFSLQKGMGVEKTADLARQIPLTDLEPHLGDYLDTARILQRLDLVISIDTSVAHLAGALARPVWLLLYSAGEWRWMRDRADSPWYPTMRIFRQPQLGDWEAVIAEVRTCLLQLRGGSKKGA